MVMDPQTVISLLLVALAVVYLARVSWRRWRSLDRGGCSGCHEGCSSVPSPAGTQSEARAGGRKLLELPSLDAPRR
jgi:hypothetical protein